MVCHGSAEMKYKQDMLVPGPSKCSFGMKLDQQQQEHLKPERTGRRVCLLPLKASHQDRNHVQHREGKKKILTPLNVSLAQQMTPWLQTVLVQLKTCCGFCLAYSLGAAALLERVQIPIVKPISLNSRGTQTGEMLFPTCAAVFPCGLWVTSSWHSPPNVGVFRH